MKTLGTFCAVFLCFMVSATAAEEIPKKNYTALRVNTTPPVIDGRMDDPVWQLTPAVGQFTQFEPNEGDAPTEPTWFKIAYDAKNLYVLIRAEDSQADKITQRVSRRDEGDDADMVGIIIDSYFDHRTAFAFSVNAAGVRMDLIFSNDGDNEDPTWDPVWYVQTRVDDKGWTAEMRIPFSQLRFGKKQEQIWGLQVYRSLYRRQELSLWQHTPRDAPGFIHLFGELHGLRNLKTPRRIELLPYAVAGREVFEPVPDDPFRASGYTNNLGVGLDGKFGVAGNLTTDFTINPDFGQVEADPSEVNLTAFESFFEEKRPFFIEGRSILNYPLMLGDGDFSQEGLFYSRRIGRRPQGSPSTGDNEYEKTPENTSIISAVKLTGKTQGGVSIGILDALTAEEKAEIRSDGQTRLEAVEPLTNYFVGRLQKDYHQGGTRIGGIFTATNRKIDPQSRLNFLNTAAYSGGVDFYHQWHNRTYYLDVRTSVSHIRGSQEAILEAQTASARYFQRPDASHVSLDSSRTSMSGHGGLVTFGKGGNGHWLFAVGGSWRSPGLELNDLGFLRRADNILQFTWVGYRIWDPFSIFRNVDINFNQWNGWNFGGERLFVGGNVNAGGQFRNYWRLNFGINREGESLSTSALRGGPALLEPGGLNLWFNINSDNRKALQISLGGSGRWSDDAVSRSRNIRLRCSYRPINSLNFELNPFYSHQIDNLQYVDTIEQDGQTRYLFGQLLQKTLGIVFRLNLSLTPNLTIQYYGQPFVSSGAYTAIKKITQPRAAAYSDRFHIFAETEIRYNPESELYEINETEGGLDTYFLDQPDFNFKEFRSNLVIRWEYMPGSTIYLVWSQDRSDFVNATSFDFGENMKDLFAVHPQNVFLLKVNRWFSL